MEEVTRASMKYRWLSWVVYDKSFRQAAAESGLKDWSNIEPSIYSQCFTGMRISQEGWCKHCESIDHTSESCPLRSMARKRPHPMGGYSSYSKRPANAAVCIKSTNTMEITSLAGIASINMFAVHAKGHIQFQDALGRKNRRNCQDSDSVGQSQRYSKSVYPVIHITQ